MAATTTIVRVAEPDRSYIMQEEGEVLNWFDITMPDGYFSINDTIGDIMKNPSGMSFFTKVLKDLTPEKDEEQKEADAGPDMAPEDLMQMISGFTVKRVLGMMGSADRGNALTKEQMLELNAKLNRIKK